MATTERNGEDETPRNSHLNDRTQERGKNLFTNNNNSLSHPRHSTTTKDKREVYIITNFSVPIRNSLLPPHLFPTFPKSHANKMQEQTPLAIHPHTHFPGVKPSHTHLSSFPAFLTAFPPPVRSRHSYLGNAFPDRKNTRPKPCPYA